jgi:hypothetical protein
MRPPRRPPSLALGTRLAFGFLGALVSAPAAGSDVRLGLALGFGGAGLSSTVDTSEVGSVPVSRSEGPGMVDIFAEYPLSDRFALGLEHSRGFRLGPFSSGMSFTGVFGRWYFNGPAPSLEASDTEKTTLLVRRFVPFLGLGLGVGSGTIERDGDLVPTVSASGVYLGYRFGADVALNRRVELRPEIIYAASFSGASGVSEVSVQCGLVFAP